MGVIGRFDQDVSLFALLTECRQLFFHMYIEEGGPPI